MIFSIDNKQSYLIVSVLDKTDGRPIVLTAMSGSVRLVRADRIYIYIYNFF